MVLIVECDCEARLRKLKTQKEKKATPIPKKAVKGYKLRSSLSLCYMCCMNKNAYDFLLNMLVQRFF